MARDRDAVRAEHEARRDELAKERAAIAERDERLSRARGLMFLATAGVALYGLFFSSKAVWTVATAAGAVFLYLVIRHAIVSTRAFELDRRLELVRRALARADGSYHAGDDEAHRRGDAWHDPEHRYSADLDLFGRDSLFEQLNVAETPRGAERLASWLLAPAPPATVAARQAAARELAGLRSFREEMALTGMRARKVDRDVVSFLAWAAAPGGFGRQTGVLVLTLALLATTAALVVVAELGVPPWTRAWGVSVAAQIVLLVGLRPRLEPVLAPVCVRDSPLAQYRDLFALVEKQRFDDPLLRELQQRLGRGGESASARMHALDRLVGLAAVRHNALIHAFAATALLWDVWCAWLVDRWRLRSGAEVGRWLDALAELEAIACLGTYAHERPDHVWPELEEGAPRLAAEALGHPLISPKSRVANDAALGSEGPAALMITGSNMSGKSTMLRSIGIAAVMAQAGAPVCARSLSLSPLGVYTSMRVDDALAQGASRFYMEVKRLRAVVDALREPGATLLFLLDEVLHGTNSRERNIGAKAVVRHLVDQGAIGGVSSHDLGLVELEALTGGRVVNVHFEDHLEDDLMRFDYRMKPGPVATSNALRLMRMVGIEVEGLEG
jgi:MutS-like protein